MQPSPESIAETDAENSWIIRLSDRYLRWRERQQALQADRVPIADQVKGLTLEERQERLRKANALLPPGEVGKPLGITNPNMQQIVDASEARQEEQRQERQKKLSEDTPNSISKFLMFGLKGNLSTGVKGANVLGVLHGVSRLLEIFADKLSESNRGLAKFNGTLASSFAAKDIAAIRADWQTAHGTAGTGAQLNLELAKLIEEVQPIRQQMTSMLNIVGVIATRVVIMYAQVVKLTPLFMAMSKSLEVLEQEAKESARKKGLPAADATRQFLAAVRDGKFARPLNPPPKKP